MGKNHLLRVGSLLGWKAVIIKPTLKCYLKNEEIILHMMNNNTLKPLVRLPYKCI